MPGPIATPTLASIDAALNPDTKDHYLYFLAKKDGSGEHGVREDPRGARAEHREVRAARPMALPSPADFAPPPTADGSRPLGRGRLGGPARPARAAAGPLREPRGRRVLRDPAREQPLPDRLRPRRRRGEGRGPLGPVPRRARRGRRAGRLALRDPGPPRGAGRRGSSTPATTCRAHGPGSSRRSVRSGSRSRPGSCRTRCGGGSRPPRRTSSSSRSRAGSRRIGRSKEPSRARAGRRGLRDRGPGARDAAAEDRAGRVREGARARAGVAAADRRRGDDRVRPDVPRRPGRRDAPRVAVRRRRRDRSRSSCSTSVPRSTATAAT